MTTLNLCTRAIRKKSSGKSRPRYIARRVTRIIGISIDKACQLLRFFCQLPLEPSQADATLTQLGKQWGEEFEQICERIALAAVVYTDETSWQVGRLNTSLWSFTSELHSVMLFGVADGVQ